MDYDKADTRFVVLSLPYGSDLEAEFPTPLWRFGKAQLEWLENTALETEKNVILLIHVPLWYEYRGNRTTTLGTWLGDREAEAYICALCGWIDDVDKVSAILNRFNERTGRLIACLSGHTHADSLRGAFEEQNNFKNPISYPQIVAVRSGVPCIGVIRKKILAVFLWTCWYGHPRKDGWTCPCR